MDSLAGQFLIAIPELPDSNFYRSVVFMIDHTEEGAMGVILNRPSNVQLKELWQNLDSDVEVSRSDSVYVGGPVEGPIVALHDQFRLADNQVLDGVWVSMSHTVLNELVTMPHARFKAFTGYSGWGPGQLEMELECGGWMVAPATSNDVFADPNELWKNICERFGNEIMMPKNLGLPSFGDPNLN